MRLVITIIICSIICLCYYGNKETNHIEREREQSVTMAVQTSAKASSSTAVRYTSEHDNIVKTLKIVTQKCKVTDVNGDGLYNCIDAAVLFYQYYPDKSKVCIEINYNPKTGMNHLFNCVFTEGVWRGIEPQAYASNYTDYYMSPIWGSKYDNTYNRDVTKDYKCYAKY